MNPLRRDRCFHAPLLVVLALLPACRHAPTAIAPPPPAIAPAPPATPAPQIPPPPATGEIGTAGPLTVEDVAADGSWVLLCQARVDTDRDGVLAVDVGLHGDTYGDALRPYLVTGSGPGVAADDVVATDPVGGHLVLVRDKRLVLLHPARGTTVDLTARGAEASDDGSPLLPHRAASFDGKGRRLLYLRGRGDRSIAIVRDLATGAEIEIDPGPGLLWRASLDPSGEWALFHVIARDTNGDGRLTPPQRRTSLAGRLCRGPISSYSTFGMGGDRPLLRVATVDGKAVREVEGLVAPIAGGLLRRDAAGALLIEPSEGPARELVPASCGAVLLGIDAPGGRFIAACTKAGKPTPLELVAGGTRRPLGTFDPDNNVSDGRDTLRSFGRHLLLEGSDAGTIVLDLETGARREVYVWQRVLAMRGARTLVNRRGALVLLDGGSERELAGVSQYPEVYAAGAMLAVDRRIVDLEAGRLLGDVSERPVAISASGWVLVAAPKPASRALADGPLRWVRP